MQLYLLRAAMARGWGSERTHFAQIENQRFLWDLIHCKERYERKQDGIEFHHSLTSDFAVQIVLITVYVMTQTVVMYSVTLELQ